MGFKIVHLDRCLSNKKMRCCLYFLGFVIFFSRFWFARYQVSTFEEIVWLNLVDARQLLLPQWHKVWVDFRVRCFIRPCLFTVLFIMLESLLFGWSYKLNYRVMVGLKYLPVLLIVLGIARFCYNTYQIDLLMVALVCSFLMALSWRLIVAQWIKSILSFLGLLLLGFAWWTMNYIGDTNVDQLLSTIMFGMQGVLSTTHEFTNSLIKYLLIFPTVITLFILFIEQWFFKINYFILKPQLIGYLRKIIPTTLMITGLSWVGIQYHISNFLKMVYFENQNSTEDYFAKNYKNPADVKFRIIGKPKNLVLIYVESLESTYQNAELFGHNLLASLSNIKQPNISFHNFKQTKGADWTIGGMVSSSCGIPLKLISIFGANSIGANVNQFLFGAICLGDVLHQQGYENVFINGSSKDFAGDDAFFKTHHYTDIVGKEEWLAKGFSIMDMIGWGLPDDLLFQQAKLKLHQLMKKNKPFNLTILTIDTHGPDGQLNKTCTAQGARKFEDIVECTANEVADFINYIDRQGWMDKVAIVVTGDHLAMKNAVSEKLSASSSRTIFNMIITEDSLQKNRETILHVDLFPTILNALGIIWSDGHLALGYSGIMPLSHKLSSVKHFNDIGADFWTKKRSF